MSDSVDTNEEDSERLGPAILSQRNCAIRQVSPHDYEWLVELLMDPVNLMTYRLGGVPPSMEGLSALLWAGVAGQFIITEARHPLARHGLVSFYARNDHAQHCGMGVVFARGARGTPWAWDGVSLAIDHWFRVTRMNKIWVEIPEWNMRHLRGLHLFGFVEEGIQRQQEWIDGRYWDRHLFAIFRERWNDQRSIRMQGLEKTPMEGAR